MASIVVVDDDAAIRDTFSTCLEAAGHRVFTAATGQQGSAIGRREQPDVALVELRLPDISGADVLRSLRRASPHTAVVMVARVGSTRAAVDAIKLGAFDYLEKPIDVDQVTEIVDRVGRRPAPPPIVAPPPAAHACARWAEIVVKATTAPEDPHTISGWAEAAVASTGAIRNWCRTANLPVKGSLNLARMLRLLALYDGRTRVADLLRIVDTRTLVAFLKLGDRTAPPCQLPMSVDDLLERQRWVVDSAALRELRKALGTRQSAQPAPADTRVPANTGPARVRL
jgi:DNA-binding response OmpR family regulator